MEQHTFLYKKSLIFLNSGEAYVATNKSKREKQKEK